AHPEEGRDFAGVVVAGGAVVAGAAMIAAHVVDEQRPDEAAPERVVDTGCIARRATVRAAGELPAPARARPAFAPPRSVVVFAVTDCAAEPGITMTCWHDGHLPLRPTCSSAAEIVMEHCGQGNLITAPPPAGGNWGTLARLSGMAGARSTGKTKRA